MNSLRTKLRLFEKILLELGAPVIESLQPGIDAPKTIPISEVMTYEDDNKGSITLPESVRQLYAWHDGVVRDDGNRPDQSLAPELVFLRLENAKDEWGILLDCAYVEEWEDVNRSWFPVAKHVGSNLVLVDCSKGKNSPDAPVRLWEHGSNDVGVIHKNVETMVDFWIECYKKGVYRLSKDGFIECADDKAEATIALGLNPRSKWWKTQLKVRS